MAKTVLITGASQGIGYELAKLFAKDGYKLILVARSESNLQKVRDELIKTYGSSIVLVPKDLAQSQAPDELYNELQKQHIGVDVLVNNAGFATHGRFESLPVEPEMEEIQVNIAALTKLTRLFLPQMVQQKSGKILNIASTAAFLPGPYMSVYYATKAYVLSFSEALSEELVGTGVTVTALCPGTTKTGFIQRAALENAPLFRKTADPKDVALTGYIGLMQGKRVVFVGLRNMIGAMLSKWIPHILILKYVKKLQAP